jgi:hypothetical protein
LAWQTLSLLPERGGEQLLLMAFAYAQNPAIGNIKDMRFLKNTTVRGVFGEPNRGKPPTEVNKACIALFGS